MNIKEIIKSSTKNIDISNIQIDSRKVRKNALFFAIQGKKQSGNDFIIDAINNGAIAIVFHGKIEDNFKKEYKNIEFIEVESVRDTLSSALGVFYNNLPKNIFAVTGTNGKTSVCDFIRQLLSFLGKKSASIGTIGVKTNEKIIGDLLDNDLTTPDIVSIYHNLSILKENNINDVVIEASSIGIDQGRIDNLKISLASFTNFTQDHLDYHKSMNQYFDSKMDLYRKILYPNSIAVINSDIKEYKKIKDIAEEYHHKVISYGKNSSDFKIISQNIEGHSMNLHFYIRNQDYNVKIPTIPYFQIENIICAIASIVSYYNLDENDIKFIISKLPEIKLPFGRMEEIIKLKNGARIFIDYAHTPDALYNIIINSKNITYNKLHILFGCGGERDITKRGKMGKIASDLADKIIITDDNPRNEDPEKIRNDILKLCDMNKTIEIEDRKKAIKYGMDNLEKDDILIIAGKGHEKYQIIRDKKIDFSEKDIILNYNNEKLYSK